MFLLLGCDKFSDLPIIMQQLCPSIIGLLTSSLQLRMLFWGDLSAYELHEDQHPTLANSNAELQSLKTIQNFGNLSDHETL